MLYGTAEAMPLTRPNKEILDMLRGPKDEEVNAGILRLRLRMTVVKVSGSARPRFPEDFILCGWR